MNKSTAHNADKAPDPVGLYPHARRVGNLLFLSGVGPRVKGSTDIPKGIEAQCRSVFANVRAILESAGARWEDLVDVTVYLTDMKNDFPTYNKQWAEHFADNPPCRTTVEVTALPTPISIELKCIAVMKEE
jgi:2-aminomuconate deaminase